MKLHRRWILLVCMSMVCSLCLPATLATASTPGPTGAGKKATPSAAGGTIDARQRDSVLPKGWRTSGDVTWTTVGDATGLHLLAADASSGYTWRTVATLAEPGLDADQWIGNACLTASGRRAVVVYAPRTFTNTAELARRGAFTAVVDMRSGAVKKLPITTSLSYFNPGCGTGESAILTQEGDEDLGATRLVRLDTATARTGRALKIKGQVTSAVPTDSGITAAYGKLLARFSATGKMTPLAATANVPFDLRADGQGGVSYLDRLNNQVRVQRTVGKQTSTLANGALGKVGLQAGTGGKVFITGSPSELAALPSAVRHLNVSTTAQVSTRGGLVLTRVDSSYAAMREVGAPVEADRPEIVRMRAVVPATGKTVGFDVRPGKRVSGRYADGRKPVRLAGAAPDRKMGRAVAGSPSNPVDDDRWCSVPRNDVKSQAYQPTARQVEWAVDLAVLGQLNVTRPANYRGFGLPSYTPQGMFPVPGLAGGGHVPPQVFLGILSQESNLWQADRYSEPGAYSNPLIGNFYGLTRDDKTGEITDWTIHWGQAVDCGYGISQMTDGMRMAGHEKSGETALPLTQQRAIALDYAANIAAGLKLVSDKWNQLYSIMTVNNADPTRIENWYFATWAYNSGFHTQSEAGQNHGVWGLGWFNNPANPRYDHDRLPFLYNNSWADAAHPERWTYPEKVLGFASWSIDTPDGPGFRPAWWNTETQRLQATPPVNQFCDASDDCEPGQKYPPTDPEMSGEPAGPCAHTYNGLYDLHCYYHQSSTWKSDCDDTCGHELIRFDPGYPEQPDGTHYPPQCDQHAGLPSGALVIDDVAGGTYIPRCGTSVASSGTFTFDFDPNNTNPATYSSKIDLHQLGGGSGGHFWLVHTRPSGSIFAVKGSWTLNQAVNGWARVMIHTPDYGAHTRQADYVLNDVLHSHRVVEQRTQANKWVSLGVFKFAGTPKVTLENETEDGSGIEDLAWDSIAIQPLSAKPKNIVVSLGDSYSSGEGASAQSNPSDYYKETDVDGPDKAPWRDACHRSPNAWSRQGTLADDGDSVGYRSDHWDPALDYHLIACSGAKTGNVLSGDVAGISGGSDEYGELPQLSQGYLDVNTTLVTISIGGNNARFTDIVKQCIYRAGPEVCQDSTLSGDTEPLSSAEPTRIKGPVRDAMKTVLLEIHRQAPNAEILFMGYPRLLDGNGQCIVGIGTAEAPWMNQMADLLDEQMSGAAADATADGAPVTFADPRSSFAGQAICGDPETIHGIVTDQTPGDTGDPVLGIPGLPAVSAQSFHPKIAGATTYSRVFSATLRTMGM
ncbi:SGNH/GDSL hydrolase family protein [Actinoallomurus oryzae]